MRSFDVTDAVRRSHHVAHEAAILLESPEDGFGVEVLVGIEAGERLQICNVLHGEADVVERRSVVAHAPSVGVRREPTRMPDVSSESLDSASCVDSRGRLVTRSTEENR